MSSPGAGASARSPLRRGPAHPPRLVADSSRGSGCRRPLLPRHLLQQQPGATLSLAGIRAKRLALLVTKCRTCGTIDIYWNGTLIQEINLTASATERKQLIAL